MYVLDEQKQPVNGTWEGYLNHDEVNSGSILIYTGEKLSGKRLSSYSVVAEGKKTKIRVSGISGTIYITYETTAKPVATPIKVDESPSIDDGPKADKLYVDGELAKKADKTDTYTKKEVNDRLSNVKTIKGDKGDPGGIGPEGKPFEYKDFTQEQLDSLKGEKGNDGITPVKNVDYFDGERGPVGKTGEQGIPGNDGYTPIKGKDYFDGNIGPVGPPGETGKQGVPGPPGKDGKTPIKGVDYFDGLQGPQGIPGPSTADSVEWSKILNKPSTFNPSAHNHSAAQITGGFTWKQLKGGV